MDKLTQDIPEHLSERMRWIQEGHADGEFVLYWMRTAVRSDENPALDVARLIASQLELPLLVYHAISEHYEFASDRHHTFMLQGARDVQQQFADLGISYAFHLATSNDRGSHLIELTNRAAVMVTEDMPVDPPRRFLNSVVANTETVICCVDTACIVPMLVVGKAHTRAFKFRESTKKQYAQRTTRAWPNVGVLPKPFELDKLPFEPLNLNQLEISDLVAECDIDHAVGPVVDTVGGSGAGYARWEQFKERGLSRYAKLRNNALVDGVSRMSAYLHYGMVSPMRIAREAADYKSGGAEKYLDELLIWRELAYSFCFYTPKHDSWGAIPSWAQETLTNHVDDTRQQTYSWEQLARGETESRLWNAAQHSLLKHGELHNNLRMTWGKAILHWTKCPRQALELILDLNHRYALDGRDPASFGGILWCLGQFDRPFSPEENIIGTVRPRPIAIHAKRLDADQYEQKIAQARFKTPAKIAVVGAGLSGLFAARTLQDHGVEVAVFEKSRGVGGRMATRRVGDNVTFDHGAQYFTVRDKRFRRYVDSWVEQGVVDAWPGSQQRIAIVKQSGIEFESSPPQRFVGNPTMNAICKHLSADMPIHKQARIVRIERSSDGYTLMTDDDREFSDFSGLILSAPAQQTAQLLRGISEIADDVNSIRMNPCWAGMYSFEQPVTDDWVGAFIHDSFLSWAAQNNTKPNRKAGLATLLIHASPDWTAENWDRDAAAVAQDMLDEFWRASSLPPQAPIDAIGHRWKYALADPPAQQQCFFDHSANIVACGDWANGSRVEGAFLSGMSAAGRLLGTLQPNDVLIPEIQNQLF